MEFTTDNNNYNLDSVTIRMSTSSNVDTSSPIEVVIYDDDTGLPGNVLHTLPGPASPVSGDFTYNATSGATLSANTPYHIIARVTSGSGEYAWPSTFLGTFVATGPGTIDNIREGSTDSGASWSEFANFGVLLSVDGTVVPEPAAPMMLGLSCLLGLMRRRRELSHRVVSVRE